MSYLAANTYLTPKGVLISYRPSWKEYRVNYIGGNDTSAYYTQDEIDAIQQGEIMVRDLARIGHVPS